MQASDKDLETERSLRKFYQGRLLKLCRDVSLFRPASAFQTINENTTNLDDQLVIRAILVEVNFSKELIAHANKHAA